FELVRQCIRQLESSSSHADLAATLPLVQEVIDRSRQDPPSLGQAVVHIVTDLGANTWNASGDALVEQLADSVSLDLVDVGDDATIENSAISALHQKESFATVVEPVEIEAEILNFGQRTISQTITWHIDGRQVAKEPITLPAGGRAA